MYSILPAPVSPPLVFGAKAPTTKVRGTPAPSHSVLLPSEPIKRPNQHSVAIQATPTLFTFRRGKGSTVMSTIASNCTSSQPPREWPCCKKSPGLLLTHLQPRVAWKCRRMLALTSPLPAHVSGCTFNPQSRCPSPALLPHHGFYV